MGRRPSYSTEAGSSGRRGRTTPEDDYRQYPSPLQSRSLADYIRAPSLPITASISNGTIEEPALQDQMESEFPKLDSALIAAILADYSDPAEARSVLSVLS